MIFREDNMIARLLKPEESWRWNQVMAAAFEWDFDLEKARAEAAREKTEEELREQGAEPLLRRAFRRWENSVRLREQPGIHMPL